MLILFDIDATMVLTSRSGLWAMNRAGKDLFGPAFEIGDIEFAGRLDTRIIPEIFRSNHVDASVKNLAEYRERYAHLLERRLADPAVIKAVLPGVHKLLAAIDAHTSAGHDITTGLLTGNFEQTGKLKLAHCGIDPARFTIGAFAEDAPHDHQDRDHLPTVALARYHERFGRAIDPARTVIIGDSPHDVRCAKVNGCRALAVATGAHSVEQLEACTPHKPDLAVSDLADTGRITTWLFGGRVS